MTRRFGAITLLVLATTGCTVQYGQPRRPFAPPVLVPLEVDCVPAANGADGLSITLLEPNRQALPGVTVHVRKPPSDQDLATIVSDSNGTANLTIPETGTRLELTVELHGFHPLRVLFDARPGFACTSSITLEWSEDRVLL